MLNDNTMQHNFTSSLFGACLSPSCKGDSAAKRLVKSKNRSDEDESEAETERTSFSSDSTIGLASLQLPLTPGGPDGNKKRLSLFRRRPSFYSCPVAGFSEESSYLSDQLLTSEDKLRRMELQGDIILKSIHRGIAALCKEEQDLMLFIAVHKDKALARQEGNNSTGALLSMKRMKHVEAKLKKVLKALSFLRRRESQLLGRITEARTMTALRNQAVGEFESLAVSCKISYDLSCFGSSSDRVQEILDSADPSGKMVEEELLLELASMTGIMGQQIEI